ncbi:GNAT family N-acetyltransferase [Noviherbaspirillum cavernae]|uniref:GNAT family N-acetyltransferase n=1 Tax=Noviherbaspirillum cavernae TaxID=2320862 RepID=A0A418WWV7_9BURK|nr:GNAT family N-acetyltransferase [Noviherbaspirillum cavernae]RJG04667.1 GNAT family N-acetyltransferase [Noviherbaspirillum cavernae]
MHEGSIYHTTEWFDFVERALGWRIHFAVDLHEGNPRYLPFVTKLQLGRRKHICLPLSHHVGFMDAISHVPKPEIVPLKSLSNIEIHDAVEISEVEKYCDYRSSVLDMRPFPDETALFSRLNKNSIQRKIIKAQKEGVVVVDESRNPGAFKIFRDMQTDTRIRQHSLMYPPKFFEILYETFKATGWVKLYLSYKDGIPLAGIIFFHFGNVATYAYGASHNIREISSLGANQVAMWTAIVEAHRAGLHYVDFGVSPKGNEDLLAYKAKWGANETDMFYSRKGQGLRISREGRLKKHMLTLVCSLPRPLYVWVSSKIMKMLL